MRNQIFLAAASSCLASASLSGRHKEPPRSLDTAGAGVLPSLPQQTDARAIGDAERGWTPKPTTGPGAADGDAVLEQFLRPQRQRRSASTNIWENERTCGWSSGVSSAPFTCLASSTCATNAESVIACVSGTFSPFFTACLNFEAVRNGACKSVDTKTGCCQTSSIGQCGTFLWSSPARSMFRCFSSQTVIPMIDEPQFVLDSLTRGASTTPFSSTTGATITTVSASSTTSSPGTQSGAQSANIGSIIGGVIGGLAALGILAVLVVFCLLRRRNQSTMSGNKKGRKEAAYNALPATDPFLQDRVQAQTSVFHAPSPESSHNSISLTSYPGATTFPPTSPYPTLARPGSVMSPGAVAGYASPGSRLSHNAYDAQQHQYYDPPKSPAFLSSGVAYHQPPRFGAEHAEPDGQAAQHGHHLAPYQPASLGRSSMSSTEGPPRAQSVELEAT